VFLSLRFTAVLAASLDLVLTDSGTGDRGGLCRCLRRLQTTQQMLPSPAGKSRYRVRAARDAGGAVVLKAPAGSSLRQISRAGDKKLGARL
jgi:hypothetical protein